MSKVQTCCHEQDYRFIHVSNLLTSRATNGFVSAYSEIMIRYHGLIHGNR